ncbi:hypothetical protein ACIBHY_54010 [Nonomuraea sp. NPDC050547]|uniref:hypothetical protein n=1 Tax=Nonomuraea sp. NPDC050547 TaxID=3364368 RepID=UPI0037A5D3FC
MHGEHDDPETPAKAPRGRQPYGPPAEPDSSLGSACDEGEPVERFVWDHASPPTTQPPDLDDEGQGATFGPHTTRSYAMPAPPDEPDDDQDGGRAWYGPELRVDWALIARVGGGAVVCVALALWAAWPSDEAESAHPLHTPTPRAAYTELPGEGPAFTSLSPADLPTATPAVADRDAPRTPSRKRGKQRERHGGGRQLSVEPQRPAVERAPARPPRSQTSKPRRGGGSDRSGRTSAGGGTSSNGASFMDRKCDDMFPPHKPDFAVRNRMCRQMYGSG